MVMGSGDLSPELNRKVWSKVQTQKRVGIEMLDFENMKIHDLLLELDRRGLDVKRALELCPSESDIGNIPVTRSTRYRTCAGKAFRNNDGTPKKIVLSYLLWMEPGNAWDSVRKTFVHEIAHLLSRTWGHTYDWRRLCISLGGSGERCHNYKTMPRRPRQEIPIAACHACDEVFTGRKRLARNKDYYCKKCNGEIERF
jgi:predicted SprT family Zn-dependent metalloprotease